MSLLHSAIHNDFLGVLFHLGRRKEGRQENPDEIESITLWTPLFYAIVRDNLEMAKVLIRAGANVNHRSVHRVTPLIKAAEFNRLETVKILVEAGANLGAIDKYGLDALYHAQNNRNRKMINILNGRRHLLLWRES